MRSAREAATTDGPPQAQPNNGVPLLEMVGIVKRYGPTLALNGVDLAVRAGEIHALLGENGAGKSTLMHVLSGLTHADAGEIRLWGHPVRIPSPRAARALGIAMVHQHFTLAPAFTVAENLALDSARGPGSGLPLGTFAAREAAAPALERAAALGWQLDPDARIADLSVGTQQRVEIVKALATQARLLIFDEPTAVLSGDEVEELFQVLRRLREEGHAVILIAHKLAEILAVADTVTVLRRGNRVAYCPVAETDARQLATWMIGVSPDSPHPLSPSSGGPHPPAPFPTRSSLAREGRDPTWDDCGPHPRPLSRSVGEGRDLTPAPSPSQGEGRRQAGSPPSLIGRGAGGLGATPGKGAGGLGQTQAKEAEEPGAAAAFAARDILVRGDRGEVAIRGLSLEVARGEILGIGGVDGNGQTELAEALIGLRPIEAGTLSWEGGPFRAGVSPTTGYIPQDRRRVGLAVGMTVEDNLLFEAVRAPQFRRGPFLRRKALQRLASDLIRAFDVRTPSRTLPVSALSGGNQQKVVVARALHANPHWIVAVNPTRGLDIGATRFVHEQLRQARARGAAIVLISTDLDEIAALADRAAILSGGRLHPYQVSEVDQTQLGLLLGGLGAEQAAPPDKPSAAGETA